MKRNVQNKNDWFYEFKPYIVLSIGAIGLILKSLMNIQGHYESLAFVSGVTLIAMGYYILKLRKEYRKKSIMTM